MKLVRCPQCGTPCEYSEKNQDRPFCSERCRLIDLGQWADEKYAVPVVDSQFTFPEDVNEENEETSDSRPKH